MRPDVEAEVNDLQAAICAGLADPHRIRLMYLLAEGPRTVGDLGEALQVPQPSMSRLLAVLRERGMVKARRQGASVLYSLADARLVEVLDLLRAVLRDTLERRTELFAEFN